MRTTPEQSQLWTQPSLFPHEAVEIVLRVGLVISTEHAQIQLEIRDAESEELIALVSRPHVGFDGVDDCLHTYVTTLTEAVREWSGPFVER